MLDKATIEDMFPVFNVKQRYQPGWAPSSSANSGDCEYLTQYTRQGLCPLLIGDKISGWNLLSGKRVSYIIVGKLGSGSFATVWLVKCR